MELQIAVEELGKALYRAQGIVEKKSTMPILANVLLDAKAGLLTVTAFDLEIGVTSEHRAEVIKEGRLAVSAKHLYDIVRTLPEPTVLLKRTENNYVEISCGTAHFRIVAMPAEDFPSLPAVEQVPFVPIRPKQLLGMIEMTSFAVSTDETRFNLNGVFFQPVAGAVRMVATDGHRLALVERPLEGDFQLKRGVIVPRKGIHELKRLLSEGSEEAELGFAENSGVFRRPGLTLIMQLINGQFPEYEQVIPKESDRTLRIGRARLLETLKRVSLLSQDQMHTVKLEIEDSILRVSSQSPELGEAREEIPLDHEVAGGLTIGFNARYLIDVLGVLGTDEVQFELHDDLSPGVIHPADDATYTAVVMPVRI